MEEPNVVLSFSESVKSADATFKQHFTMRKWKTFMVENILKNMNSELKKYHSIYRANDRSA